ncbi:MAG: MBL fold metallo-hydrolase [Clostridia bacterium]|nr:MBL fold metallo-hydrolase [Clostridia bacterium]
MKHKKSVIWLVFVLIASFFITKFTENEPGVTGKVQLAENEMGIVYVDTGNSDSIVIHFPDGRTMLIDAGKPDDFDAISDVLDSFSEDTIDYAVITHQHDDHIGSFPDILENYEVGTVYMPTAPISNPQTEESMELISELDIPLVEIKSGVVVCDGIVKAEFLSPMYEHYGDKNDYSGVLHLTYGEQSFLFMGDATTDVENDMLSKGVVPRSDVLKIGHHGSKSSTSKKFLDAVAPQYAIITTGENDYGHPHKRVTDLLNAKGINVYRSDLHGDILVITDGKSLSVTHE